MPFETVSFVTPKQQMMLRQFRPTLLIGLGGTGKDVLLRLRKMLFDQGGTPHRPYLRYLMIDTDEDRWWPQCSEERDYQDVRQRPDEFIGCRINAAEFGQVFAQLRREDGGRFAGWLHPDLERYGPQALACGAAMHRQLGRMAFMLRYPEIRRGIEVHLLSMLQQVAALPRHTVPTETIEQGAANVVIVTSLAGGTGAGMFIDIACLVRDIVQSHPALSQLAFKTTTLIAVMPAAFAKVLDYSPMYRRLQQNGYACLLEMEHYGSARPVEEAVLAATDRRPRVGFAAPWKQNTFVEGVAWDVCYLIDGANADQPHLPLDLAETYQMIADFLRLDFARTQFSEIKRSGSCNLAQYRQDRIGMWVRSPLLVARGAEPGEQSTDVVFATQHSCSFSSFGLSEIRFPRERVQRAAGYLLAARLVLERWLAPATRLKTPECVACVRQDLFDDPGTPSFRPEHLLRNLYREEESDWHALAEEDCVSLRGVSPHQATAGVLRMAEAKHEHLLQGTPPGPAYETLMENARRLGDLSSGLPPLHQRVHDAARRRADRLGVAAARELLPYYGRATHDVSRWFAAKEAGDDEAMRHLEEAEAVHWPARKIAMQIEFPRACEETCHRILDRYREAAESAVDGLMARVRDFIGVSDGGQPEATLPCETLRQYFERAARLLQAVGARLRQRFGELRREQGSDRRQLLSPVDWTEDDYRVRIDRGLALHPHIGTPANGGFDWSRFEECCLADLPADGMPGARGPVHSLTELLDRWFQQHGSGEEGVAVIADELATACCALLAGGSLDLRDFCDGVVPVILQRQCASSERDGRLKMLVRSSGPYFPLDVDLAAWQGQYRPIHVNLLGLEAGYVSEACADDYRETVKQVRDHGMALGAGMVDLTTADGDGSSLTLCREMWGIPLAYYGRLHELYAAYREWRWDFGELHINCHECAAELPDIRPLSPAECEQIGAHADTVVLAIMRGTIGRDQDGSYCVRTAAPVAASGSFRLGTRLGRVIRRACGDDAIREHLRRDRAVWESQATAQQWAIVFAAAVWTHDSLRDHSFREGVSSAPQVSPLRNLAAAICRHCERHLAETEVGCRWRDYFACAARPDEEREAAVSALFDELIDQKRVLFRPSDAVPLWTVDWSKQDQVLLPPS